MSKRYIIKSENFPRRPPLLATFAWITILHYWNAPEWLCWTMYVLCGLAWLYYFHRLFAFEEEEIDIFDGINPPPKDNTGQSKWKQRLAEVQEAQKKAQQNKNS